MFFPDLRTEADIYREVERLAQEDEEIFRRWGYAVDPMDYPSIRYQSEPTGLNVYANVEDVLQRGVADCEDLTAWMIALLRWYGYEAHVLALRQTETLFHIVLVVKLNQEWVVIDPSKWKGMQY